MKFIVFFRNKKIEDLVTFFIQGCFDCHVTNLSNAGEIIDLLINKKEIFNLFVGDFSENILKLSAFLVEKNIGFYFVFLLQENPEPVLTEDQKKWIHFVRADHFVLSVIAQIKKLLHIDYFYNKNGKDFVEYCVVKSHLFIGLSEICGNLYFKLSDKKYVCIVKLGVSFDQTDFDYYKIKKNLEIFYIERQQCLRFAMQLQGLVFLNKKNPVFLESQVPAKASSFEVEDRKPVESKTAVLEDAVHGDSKKQIESKLTTEIEQVYEMSDRLGFTAEVRDVTKKNVANTIRLVRNTPKLSALLSQLKVQNDKYIPQHSMLLAYVSCALSTQIEWSSDTTYQKLTLASFLHDISLHNHELAAIQSLSELAEHESRFTPEEIKAFKDHPVVCSEIARQFTEIPPDVDLIIVQHHERPDGTGFPRGLSYIRIGPLAAIFIVAHDFVNFLFKADIKDSIPKSSLKRFFDEKKNIYRFSGFKKVLSAVLKLK